MSERMTTSLVSQALFRAVAARRPAKELIHHSDRGSQYCAHAYQRHLQQFGMQASMSKKRRLLGQCPDGKGGFKSEVQRLLTRTEKYPGFELSAR